jgi:hypothetical protein
MDVSVDAAGDHDSPGYIQDLTGREALRVWRDEGGDPPVQDADVSRYQSGTRQHCAAVGQSQIVTRHVMLP